MQGIDEFKPLVIYDFGHKKLTLYYCGNKCFYRKEHKGEILTNWEDDQNIGHTLTNPAAIPRLRRA
jgi:hypothetical protein